MCDVEETYIGFCCVEEPYLQRKIEKEGMDETCHYCSKNGLCFSLTQICDLTEKAVEQHFIRTAVDPSTLEYLIMSEGDGYWEREGDQVHIFLENLLITNEHAASDIQRILEDRYYDLDSAAMGEETEFDSDSHYSEIFKVDTDRLDLMWKRFVISLKTESRFVNNSIKSTLDNIFQDIEMIRTVHGNSVVIEAGPGTAIPYLYRARHSSSRDELENMLTAPDVEIGPPPHHKSGSNRMSAKGISVFYGSDSSATAIPETRPPVGCNVVSAKFNLLRPLRLLDLNVLADVRESGSVFDPDFINRRKQLAFLRTLTERIVNPVLPGEQDFSYIPTQVIAEYLANMPQLNLDGIRYPSVQDSGEQSSNNFNVVLFHKASRVRYLHLPQRAHCQISYDRQYAEDDWDPDVCVTQIKASAESDSAAGNKKRPTDGLKDNREYSLEIDLPSVCMHYINAVHFSFSTESVRREKHIITPLHTRRNVRDIFSDDDNDDFSPF